VNAATYARVSTSEQAVDGTSLSTQKDQCRLLIEMKGWTHVAEFVDEGVSDATRTRPQLDRLIAAARNGSVQTIVVSKLDRLGRSLRDLANMFAEFDELGVAVVSVSESFDSSTSRDSHLRDISLTVTAPS
jgi:site-specific DNA recombinase